MIFEKLMELELKLKLSKCVFFKTHLQYVGHLLSREGMYPLQVIVAALLGMLPPSYMKENRHTGLAFHYRKFIANSSNIMRLLNEMTRKSTNIIWNPLCQVGFVTFKIGLTNSPISIFPLQIKSMCSLPMLLNIIGQSF